MSDTNNVAEYPLIGYEYALILEALEELRRKTLENSCRWERQDSGHYGYTSNKKVKQIDFVLKHVKAISEKEKG